MLAPAARDRLLALVADGAFLAVVVSPPCETWSIARFLPGGPRPLRSAEAPWGLPQLSAEEYAQLFVATALLRVALRAILAAHAAGVAFLLEHPRDPQHYLRDAELAARAPSIWRTAPLLYIAGLPGVSALSFNQGDFGQASPKPTTFLYARLPELPAQLDAHTVPVAQRPSGALDMTTRGPGGRFATAQLKEFPPALNSAIAAALARAHALRLEGPLPPQPAGRAELLAGLADGPATSDAIGADYVPSPSTGAVATRRAALAARRAAAKALLDAVRTPAAAESTPPAPPPAARPLRRQSAAAASTVWLDRGGYALPPGVQPAAACIGTGASVFSRFRFPRR